MTGLFDRAIQWVEDVLTFAEAGKWFQIFGDGPAGDMLIADWNHTYPGAGTWYGAINLSFFHQHSGGLSTGMPGDNGKYPRGSNSAYMDGHAKWRRQADMKDRVNRPSYTRAQQW